MGIVPKRVILSGCSSDYEWGASKLRDILNALAAYQKKPLPQFEEIKAAFEKEDAILHDWEAVDFRGNKIIYPSRGVRLRRFSNGNGHLFFEPSTLRDINFALAEYYGDVLPDCSEDKPTQQRPGTAVSKDLQYYPTPAAIVKRMLGETPISRGDKVLEPSCGCGRILDALKAIGVDAFGIEVDPGRAAQARAKGHSVLLANFLETEPTPIYDRVLMNPPFYGQHYAKHIKHALKFLKPCGKLVAVLPATARYDHRLVDGFWVDLPVGSFSESGTNINTTMLTIWAPGK